MSLSWQSVPGSLHIEDEIDTPTLVVDLERVESNLEDMADHCRRHGIELVPHTKTHRTPEYAQMQVDRGASALCVAKLGEIEVLAESGFNRFVMAYPLVGRLKYRRAIDLLGQGVEIRFTTDHAQPATEFGAMCSAAGVVADMAIKVDTGFGRVGVLPSDALELAAHLDRIDGLRLRGFICHEGHAAGAPDGDQLHSMSIETGRTLTGLAESGRSAGLSIDTVSVGSTATAKHTTLVEGVTEVRPGIYPFNDFGQVVRGTVGLERCAARVLATVVSRPDPARAVIDAGSKSLGQDQLSVWFEDFEPGHGLVVDHPGWSLHQLSEEHGWMRWTGEGPPSRLDIGSVVQVVPNHICTAFHALGVSTVIRDGLIVGEWVATGRGASR